MKTTAEKTKLSIEAILKEREEKGILFTQKKPWPLFNNSQNAPLPPTKNKSIGSSQKTQEERAISLVQGGEM